MRKSTTAAFVLIFGTALYTGQTSLAHAQQATIKRTDLAKADQSATDAGDYGLPTSLLEVLPVATPTKTVVCLCPGGIGDIGDG